MHFESSKLEACWTNAFWWLDSDTSLYFTYVIRLSRFEKGLGEHGGGTWVIPLEVDLRDFWV